MRACEIDKSEVHYAQLSFHHRSLSLPYSYRVVGRGLSCLGLAWLDPEQHAKRITLKMKAKEQKKKKILWSVKWQVVIPFSLTGDRGSGVKGGNSSLRNLSRIQVQDFLDN